MLDIVTSDDFWVNVADGRLHMGGDFVYANLSLGQSFDAFGVDIRYTHPDQTFNWWNDGQPGRPLPDFLGVWFKHDPVGGPDDPFYGEFQFLTYTPCFDPNFQCWGQDPNVNDFPQISFDNLAFHTLAPATSVPEPSALLLVAGALGAGAGQPGTSLGLSARLQPLPDLSERPNLPLRIDRALQPQDFIETDRLPVGVRIRWSGRPTRIAAGGKHPTRHVVQPLLQERVDLRAHFRDRLIDRHASPRLTTSRHDVAPWPGVSSVCAVASHRLPERVTNDPDA